MEEIRNHFRYIAKVLSAKARVAGATGHTSTTGRVREIIVRDFLRPHIPKTLDIKSGIIIDSNGKRSKQQDCVIIDSQFPLIDIESDTDALLIAESVLATIEVKSFLDTKELKSTLESSFQTKSLIRKGVHQYKKGNVLIEPNNSEPIYSYIFAYDGINLNTLIEKMADFYLKKKAHCLPEAVCLLNKGVILKTPSMPIVDGNNVQLPPIGKFDIKTEPYKKDALLAFYRRLIDDIMHLRLVRYSLGAYYKGASLE
jgi:hypothetical protein